MTEINDIQAFCDENEDTSAPEAAEVTEAAEPVQETDQAADVPPPEDEQPSEPAPSGESADPLDTLKAMLAQQHSEQLSYISALSTEVEALSEQVAAGNRAVKVHEEIEHNLNDELQRYKNDFYDRLVTPFLMQFIGLYIDITEEMDEIRADSEAEPDSEYLKVHLKSLGYYADSVRGVLTNNGVEIKHPEPGSKYDYKEQRISKTVPADDPELRDCIASAKSDSFIFKGKVLRPAKVTVYKV